MPTLTSKNNRKRRNYSKGGRIKKRAGKAAGHRTLQKCNRAAFKDHTKTAGRRYGKTGSFVGYDRQY